MPATAAPTTAAPATAAPTAAAPVAVVGSVSDAQAQETQAEAQAAQAKQAAAAAQANVAQAEAAQAAAQAALQAAAASTTQAAASVSLAAFAASDAVAGSTTIPSSQQGSSITGTFASNFALCSSSDDSSRRLSVTAITGFDPLEITQEIVVTIVVIVAIFFLWRFRREVTILLTGDDRIHANLLDCVNFTWFRCCGLCSHDWTRYVSSCFCCPQRVRGSNLVKAITSCLGVSTSTVELSNIVVGDLPFYRRATFYITVECAANPPMTTALQEDKNPKTVHFPEIITLKIRDSYLDSQVVITVWQLNFVGAAALCSVRLSPRSVFDWCYENNGAGSIRRFAMKPHDQDLEVETPPWISLEFSPPTLDVRHLDHFHGNISETVRTATWGEINARTQAPYEERDMTKFKHDYTLVDGTGNHVNETPEDDIKSVARVRYCVVLIYSTVSSLVLMAIAVYAVFRYYVHNCYQKFELLTIAKSWQPHQFPMPTCALRSIAESCDSQLSGTGVEEGTHICRPDDETVLDVCMDPPQDRPRAFQYIAEDLHVSSLTAPCFYGVCSTNQKLRSYDKEALIAGSLLLIFTLCCFRPLANECVKSYKNRLQKNHNSKQTQRR